jgi:hypothetical protein
MSSSVEILGQWITLPDPDSVASLSTRYYGVCTTLADAKSQLGAIGSPQATARWTGSAADTFATRLGRVPGELEQAWQSYEAVARALSSYSSNLRPVVAGLRSLAYQAEEAERTLYATQAARDQAIQAGQESTGGVWGVKLEAARADVGLLALRRSALLTELDLLSALCVRQIRQAEPEGILQEVFSDLERYAVDAGLLILRSEYEKDRFEFMVAKDFFYDPVATVVGDFTHLKKGPWTLARMGKVLEDVSGVLGLVAFLIAPIPGLDFADSILVPAAMGFGLAAAGFTAAARLKHEKGATWTDVAFDVGGVALMGSSNVIGQGLKMTDLDDGPEAEVSASSLWQSGTSHFVELKAAPNEAGVEVSASQQIAGDVKTDLDLAGDALGVGADEYQKHGGQ